MSTRYFQNRKRLEKLYNHHYSRAKLNQDECAYCGSIRQCTDHVPALMYMEYMDVDEFKRHGGECIIYPCCLECNAYLGRSQLHEFYDRLDLLSIKYIKKLDKTEAWSKHDLKEMGPNLRSYIQGHQNKISIWIKKLEVIENRKLSIELKDEEN